MQQIQQKEIAAANTIITHPVSMEDQVGKTEKIRQDREARLEKRLRNKEQLDYAAIENFGGSAEFG